MKYTTLYLLFFCTLTSQHLVGQPLDLTCEEKLEIKKRAQLKLEELEALLRFVADPTRSRGAVDQAIKSSYTDGRFFKQVFYDSTVRVENDILPYMDASSESDITVEAYLSQFKLFYEKSREATIFFENLWFSDIQRNQFIYMVVSYESRFTGTHRELKGKAYQLQRRSATLRAEYNTALDHWEVWIVGVTFRRENSLPSFPADPCNNLSVADPVDINPPASVTVDTATADIPAVNALPETESLHFTKVPQRYKQGRKYNITWNPSIDTSASLSLYQEGMLVKTLKEDVSGNAFVWEVPKTVEKGKNYQFQLGSVSSELNALDGQATISSVPFRIGPRFPLGLKVGISAGVLAGYVLFAKSQGLFPFDDTKPTDLEELPSPPSDLP